ncbi:MAG: hypothetical protein ABSG14_09080 [Verrucomicrobiia bacterium]|jgi:hypothetical protein
MRYADRYPVRLAPRINELPQPVQFVRLSFDVIEFFGFWPLIVLPRSIRQISPGVPFR